MMVGGGDDGECGGVVLLGLGVVLLAFLAFVASDSAAAKAVAGASTT